MSEALWLTCEDPDRMCELLEDRASDRQWQLFTSACCRRIWQHLLAPCSRRVIELIELVAEGATFTKELEAAAQEAAAFAESDDARISESGCSAAFAAANATRDYPRERLVWVTTRTAELTRDTLYWSARETHDSDGDLVVTKAEAEGDAASRAEEKVQAALLREIFGNPFRPVPFSPSWRTSTTVAIASGMYDARDFSAIPILADALQDAGCDRADVLEHCRSTQPHVRGCWVVDLVLGKS